MAVLVVYAVIGWPSLNWSHPIRKHTCPDLAEVISDTILNIEGILVFFISFMQFKNYT